MSWYYNYYIGYMDRDGKLWPLGPYDCEGKLRPAMWKSRSFETGLAERFASVQREQASDPFLEQFEYDDWKGEKTLEYVSYLPVKDLPAGSFVKRGYFLREDIAAFEKDENSGDLFYDFMTPAEYAIAMSDELQFGPPAPKEDDCGELYTPHSIRDYSYYAYPNYSCEEYDASVLRLAAEPYEYTSVTEGKEIVIICTQG